MKFVELQGKWPVWRCGICQEDFSPDNVGWMGSKKHAVDEHNKLPKAAGVHLADEKTGEVLEEGCGPQNQRRARDRGYVLPKGQTVSSSGGVTQAEADDDADELGGGKVVPIDSNKRARISGDQRRPTAMVLADNVRLGPSVHWMFLQAQAEYDYENTRADYERFIEEAVIMYGMSLGLQGASLFKERLAEALQSMQGGE